MLERLRIQNFKSWQDTGDMAFAPLTGFFGTNSSGKSSILQFLLMLKQTVESSDRSRVLHLGDDKSYVDLGTMYDILHNHKDPGTINFSLEWKLGLGWSKIIFPGIKIRDLIINQFSFYASVKRVGDFIFLKKFGYGINKYQKISWYQKEGG